jgi:hypothetical protein
MEANNQVNKKTYPRFIVDKPLGIDDYESKSQTKIANNIAIFLKENEIIKNRRRVIGIEGEWGSGKSNVVEILKKDLKEKYSFYIFDAWGHQEDLTRRSILEGLLNKLILDEVLSGERKKWEKKLKSLLSKKVEKEHKNIPKLSWAIILSFIGLLCLPVSRFIAELVISNNTIAATASTVAVSPSPLVYFTSFIILITPLLPLSILIFIRLVKVKQESIMQIISELFYIFKGKEIVNTTEETISESEPTVRQFTEFLLEIEESCLDKKLIIVFDNMDRLPAEKVIKIWSSIHTFFANDDCKLQTWAMVPFDDNHICSIFKKDKNDDDKQRADSYIHKTFTIVFHIAPPVLSDWKSIFSKRFEEAFGYTPPLDQNIETIFDYHYKTNPKIKPRDIICFINDLVALVNLRDDDIPLKYLAVYALKRKEISINPYEMILSTKEFLGFTVTLFEDEEKLETFLSALAFNAPVEKADELLLKRTIEKVLMGVGDLKKISDRKAFFQVFNSAFYATSNLDIIYTISRFEELPPKITSQPEMQYYWQRLSTLISKEKFELIHVNAIKILSVRLKNFAYVEQILRYLFRNSILINEVSVDQEKFYYGSKYYDLISEFEELLQVNWEKEKISSLLSENNVEAQEYFQFMDQALEKYNQYKVRCEVSKINKFLIAKFTDFKISEHYSDIKLLRNDDVDLTDFISHMNSVIPTISTTLPNCELIVKDIYNLGKILSEQGKLQFVLPEVQITKFLSSFPNHECATSMLLSIIRSNIANANPNHINNAVINKMLANIKLAVSFVHDYSYYFTYSDLIIYYFSFPSVLIKEVIKSITLNSDSVSGSSIDVIIPQYNLIKTKIFDNDETNINLFITKLSTFYNSNDFSYVFDDNSLEYIIPIIADNFNVASNLINDLISQSNNFLIELDAANWEKAFSGYQTSKNFELFKTLVNTNKYSTTKITPNANFAYLNVLTLICTKEIIIPKDLDFWNKLYNMHNGNLTLTFKKIRDELLKTSTHGDVTLEELMFFEKGLFEYGELNQNAERANEVLRLILIPLANGDENYINILNRNANVIKDVIDISGELIVDYKNTIDKNCNSIYEITECKPFTELLLNKVQKIEQERFENRLIIESAAYGHKDKYLDVTLIVEKLLQEKNIFTVDNISLECDGEKDPIQNTVKELILKYKIKKQSKSLIANENESIALIDDELNANPTDKSIEKQNWIKNTKAISKIIKGEWNLSYLKGEEKIIEKISIDEDGKYYSNDVYQFNLLVKELDDKKINFKKIDFENKVYVSEQLSIISADVITGLNNHGIKLEYKKIRIGVNINLKDKDKFLKSIANNAKFSSLKTYMHDNKIKTDYFTFIISDGKDLFNQFEVFLKTNKIDYIDYGEI